MVGTTIFATLLTAPFVGASAISQPSNIAQGQKTTQANQLNFETPISLDQAKEFFTDKKKFKNLKTATLTAQIQTQNHIIPVPLELDLTYPGTILEKYTNTKKALAESIREAKKNPKPTNQKFDRNEILKSHKLSTKQSPGVAPLNQKIDPTQTPPLATVTEADLVFYEQNGVLPIPQVNEAELREKMKELGMPADYPVPSLDPKQRGKMPGATQAEREAAMTSEEKAQLQTKQAELKLQEEITTQTTEQDLVNLETNSELRISSISYLTDVGDNSAKDLAKKANKEFRIQTKESDQLKPSKKQSNNTKPNKNKLEDSLNVAVAQDITSMFQVSEAEQKPIKDKTKQDLEDYKASVTKAKAEGKTSQHNQIEADMYKKEGIDVEALGSDIIRPLS